MSLLAKLPHWFETRPLVLLSFSDGFEHALLASRRGLDRFTFAEPHGVFRELKLPTLCLVEMTTGVTRQCYVGVVKSKGAVTTFDSRLTVIKLQTLNLPSLEALTPRLEGRNFQTALNQKLAAHRAASALSPKLSVSILEALCRMPENARAIEAAAFHIPKLRQVSATEWEQFDAVRTAMSAFGLSKADFPESLATAPGSDSTLNYLDTPAAHALEDNVIAQDASVIPGFMLLEKHVTGRAVFSNGEERLVIYTANRGPLETMLGVDLIYMNENLGNAVMVQYKMLELHSDPVTAKSDWIFRPDAQSQAEMDRMKLLPIPATIEDYRLHRSPFFFKFVQRKGDGETHKSFVVSLEHLKQFLDSPKSHGPKGGVRVSYDAFEGTYLRDTDLVGLIRSGYIGTHRVESEMLNPLISQVANGDRAIVLAWQSRTQAGEAV